MGFLPRNKAPENFERELCLDIWKMVRGEEQQGVSFDTLRVVMLSMIGIRTKDREITSNVDPEYASSIAQGAQTDVEPLVQSELYNN